MLMITVKCHVFCRFHTVYVVFLYLGVATLLPWNFFITAKQVRNRPVICLCIISLLLFKWGGGGGGGGYTSVHKLQIHKV